MFSFFGTNALSSGPLLWLIADVLSDSSSLSLEEIVQKLQPRSLHEKDLQQKIDPIKNTVAVGVELGVFGETGRNERKKYKLQVGTEIVSNQRDFRREVRSRLFGGVEGGPSVDSDLAAAVVWFMTADPRRTFANGKEAIKRTNEHGLGHKADGDAIVGNDTQWNHLLRWLDYLGLVIRIRRGRSETIAVDLCAAIEDEFDELKPEMAANKFLEHFSGRMPFIDPSFISSELDRLQVRPEKQQSLSSCSAFADALFILEQSGRLSFERLSDSRSMITLIDSEGAEREISKVRVVNGSK